MAEGLYAAVNPHVLTDSTPWMQLKAERARRAAEERKQRQEAMRHEMLAANQLQLQLKVVWEGVSLKG